MNLELEEKCRLIALYGDISERNRMRWLDAFIIAPPEAELTYAPRRIIGHLDDGRLIIRRSPSLFDE